MSRRHLLAGAGLGSVAAAATAAAALAAYESPRLLVSQGANRVTIDFAQSKDDEPTAVVRLASPSGTEIAGPRPPGTRVGSARALFVATERGGAEIRAEGPVVTAAGESPETGAPTCAQGGVAETWSIDLAGDGLALELPVYVLAGADLLVCLPHPATAVQGSKLIGLQLVLDDAFALPAAGTWISLSAPFDAAGVADVNRAVASPATVGPGSITLTARPRGAGALVVGRVVQAGSPRGNVKVTIRGGSRPAANRRLGSARTNAAGNFTFRARTGTYFRAVASAGRSSPPGLCFVLEQVFRPFRCVNPTLAGFTARSKTVKKR